jgi:succinyl-diaminopimelate desuccinylase
VASIDELALAERLIAFDTSTAEGIHDALGFVSGWLEAHGIEQRTIELDGPPALIASAGHGPRTIVWSSHVDVVPGDASQFVPRQTGGRLYGRGAYDMKGALAAMLAALADLAAAPETAPGIRTELLIVPDEESEARSHDEKATARLADAGHVGEFVICGEPTDLEVGVHAKGALVLRLDVRGRSAHGSTPWLGENAVLKAVDLARRVTELPFTSVTSPLFAAGPTVNLGRIEGGDAVNRVPDRCSVVLDIRYLPEQDPDEIVAEVRGLGSGVETIYHVPAAAVDPEHPHVRALQAAVVSCDWLARTVGRDGASDASVFLARGVPSVEFGPVGAGHHGPDEYVEIASLGVYRRALCGFLTEASTIGRR